jgi:hypothetical protein
LLKTSSTLASFSGDHGVESSQPGLSAFRLPQHAGREIERDHFRAPIAMPQCFARVTGAGAEIEDGFWLESNDVESLEQAVTNFRRNRRGVVISTRRLIE